MLDSTLASNDIDCWNDKLETKYGETKLTLGLMLLTHK